jgi:hypothetical protein
MASSEAFQVKAQQLMDDHSLDQQLCRWLLLSLDRLEGIDLVMTQELLANMLGLRREKGERDLGAQQQKSAGRRACAIIGLER